MPTSLYPPAGDPETIPEPSLKDLDFDDPNIDPENDPDTGELSETDEDDDDLDIDEEDPDGEEEDPDIDDEEDGILEDEP